MVDTVLCECGCGNKIAGSDSRKRKRRFINGHNSRVWNPKGKSDKMSSPFVVDNNEHKNGMRKNAGRERKVLLIWKLGGKCNACGLDYNGENGAMFQFHHKDPTTKEFTIGSSLTDKSIQDLQKEVDKCNLLCANCHSVHHIGEY